jgi:hypothetical protein
LCAHPIRRENFSLAEILKTTAANRKIAQLPPTEKFQKPKPPPYTPSNTPNHARHDFIHSSVTDIYTPSEFPKPTAASHKNPLTLLTFHTFASPNLIAFTMSTQHPFPGKPPISSLPLPAESNHLTNFDRYDGLTVIPRANQEKGVARTDGSAHSQVLREFTTRSPVEKTNTLMTQND